VGGVEVITKRKKRKEEKKRKIHVVLATVFSLSQVSLCLNIGENYGFFNKKNNNSKPKNKRK
jgi:hypothetical protein